jgi:ribonuclease D
MNHDFIYIDTATGLDTLCQEMNRATWLAVDTEFERERTYYPELCLLQIASTEITAIIDPLALPDFGPVFDLLYNPAITKVFHSARQDLEIFFHLQGRLPLPLYDTQLAAAAAGFDNSIGYANLVEKMLTVTLDKAHTRTDWKRRPLKPSHLRYAADDVIYLGLIYEQLQTRITQPDKLAGLHKELQKLNDPLLYLPDPATMWQKIRESRKFSGAGLALLQDLAAWRELTARTENQPRKWIMPDQPIIDIARLMPTTETELGAIKGLPPGLLLRHGTDLLALVMRHCNKN